MSNPIAVPGTIVPSGSLTNPGGAQGVQGIQGPTAVSTDAGNIATLGSDSKILVPQSSIWSMRLRSFNAIGNPTFEVDQINVGNTVAAANTKTIDRWVTSKAGTMVVSAAQQSVAAGINLPGTSFALTRSFFRVTLTTQEASLAAGDYLEVFQTVEGPRWRELQNDVHSTQILVRSSVGGLAFGLAITDLPGTHSLTSLFTIPTANTWTLLTLPNLPVWPTGNFINTPGSVGYLFQITLAAGSTYMSPANGSWQNGNFIGAVGQSNFAASSVGSTFDIAFVQHEPGPLCTIPIDCSFDENLWACKRYFQKTARYVSVVNNTADGTYVSGIVPSTPIANVMCIPPFPRSMVRNPITLYTYDATNGATMGAYNISTGTHFSVSAAPSSENGITYLSLTAGGQTAGQWFGFNYSADTGW